MVLGELATTLENFTCVKRDDQNHYIFGQVTGTLFQDIPPVTVRRWVRKIGKRLVPSTSLERTYLARQGLSKFGHLISEDDLRALIQHSKVRRPYAKRCKLSQHVPPPSPTEHDACANETVSETVQPPENTILPAPCTPPVVNVAEKPDQQADCEIGTRADTETEQEETRASNNVAEITPAVVENVAEKPDQQADCEIGTRADTETEQEETRASNNVAEITPAVVENIAEKPDQQADCEIGTRADTETEQEETRASNNVAEITPAVVENVAEKPDQQADCEIGTRADTEPEQEETRASNNVPCKIGCLKREDTCDQLQSELDELSKFYRISVNPLRKCSAFSPSTLSKFLERVKCFLNFCRIKYPQQKLDFRLVENVDIVQSYTTYQIEERKLNISTVVRTITALINLCKFLHRSSEDLDSCASLVRLKNVQRQLSERQHRYQLAVKAGLCDDKTPSFMFQHILDTIKSLKDKVDCSKGKPGHIRMLHDFLMIALYVTSMCGRSKELRTLEFFHESLEGKEFQFDWKRTCNVFVVSADEKHFTLYENDFKNVKNRGPSKFEMDSSMWLIPYVKEYVCKRQDLLSGKSHSFMFMTVTGLPFSSSSFTSYLSGLFEKEVSIRAGTTKLRHALVTHILSLPEAESLRLRESLAELMRHSLKHQQQTYCDISRQERTSLSRSLVNESVEKTVEGGSGVSVKNSEKCERRSDIAVGDIVALLDSVSTSAENASIFVGRVVKVRGDEALLMEFRCVNSAKRLYRPVVDSSWWESLNALVYPVDIVYDRKNELYELRSSPSEVFQVVFPGR